MSTDPSILLRLLEPAVRPDGGAVSGATRRPAPGGTPFEQTPFEQLLNDARGSADPARPAGATASQHGPAERAEAQERPADPLAKLADMDRIENAVLREALAAARPQSDRSETE